MIQLLAIAIIALGIMAAFYWVLGVFEEMCEMEDE